MAACTLAVCGCLGWLIVEVRALADAVGYIDDDATVMAVDKVGQDVKEIRRIMQQRRPLEMSVPNVVPVVPRVSPQTTAPTPPYVPEPDPDRIDREARFY
jgi:hypothetical protein